MVTQAPCESGFRYSIHDIGEALRFHPMEVLHRAAIGGNPPQPASARDGRASLPQPFRRDPRWPGKRRSEPPPGPHGNYFPAQSCAVVFAVEPSISAGEKPLSVRIFFQASVFLNFTSSAL